MTMEMTLNLKITHEANTERPFFMVTPTCGTYSNPVTYYPLFVGSLKQVARFVSQCCNTTLEIAIDDKDIRVEMSKAIEDMRS